MASPDVVSVSPGEAFDQAWNEPPAPAEPQPAPASPAPAAAPAEPAAPRDDKGRFVKRDEAPPAAAAPQEEPPAPPPGPSADEQAAPAAEGEQPPAEQVEAEAVFPEFEYTVNGRALSIPGSKVGEDGIFIPAAQVPEYTRHLIAGQTARQRERDHGRQLAAARTEHQLEVEKARNVLRTLAELVQDDAKFEDWRANLKQNWELLLAKAENEALKQAKDEASSTLSEQQSEQAARDLVPQLQTAVKRSLDAFKGRPEYQGVDFERLEDRIYKRHFDQVFSEAEDDDPERQVRAGEILFHPDVIQELVQDEAAILARGRSEAAKLAQAAKKNQPVVAQQAAQAGGKKAPVPSAPAKTEPTKFESGREAIDYYFGEGFDKL